MAEIKKEIAIAESSHLMRGGFVSIASRLPFVETVKELDLEHSLSMQIEAEDVDMLVINPLLLGTSLAAKTPREALKIKKDIPIVALVYNLIDVDYLKDFDMVINITDSLNVITEKLQKVVDDMDMQSTDNAEELSDREKEILVAVVKGHINKEIADQFNLSIHTVIAHRRNITRKLSIHSVSGLTVYAILNKLVDLNDIKII